MPDDKIPLGASPHAESSTERRAARVLRVEAGPAAALLPCGCMRRQYEIKQELVQHWAAHSAQNTSRALGSQPVQPEVAMRYHCKPAKQVFIETRASGMRYRCRPASKSNRDKDIWHETPLQASKAGQQRAGALGMAPIAGQQSRSGLEHRHQPHL